MEKVEIRHLVTDAEIAYFLVMLAISVFSYILMILSVVGIIYILIIALVIFFIQGYSIGLIKQNAVKINQDNFSDIYERILNFSQKLDLKSVPDVYLLQSDGQLNAFATRFLFKNIVVIYSDVLNLAYEQGESAVDFVIAHELAHVKREHLTKRKYICLAEFVPFLGLAYSRACELTCDNIAARLTEKLPLDGLLVLTAGTKLYKKVNVEAFIKNGQNESGFWCWFAQICSTHPSLVTRVKNIKNTL